MQVLLYNNYMVEHSENAPRQLRFERVADGVVDVVYPLEESRGIPVNVPRSNGGISIGEVTAYNVQTDIIALSFMNGDVPCRKNISGADFRTANPNLSFAIEGDEGESEGAPVPQKPIDDTRGAAGELIQ